MLFGSGLRLTESLELRIKDIDFGYKQIVVRSSKREKDRTAMLPEKVVEPLKTHLQKVKQIHKEDLKNGYGTVYLPYAIERKYSNAKYDWGWQHVFPATKISTDTRTGIQRRHHLYDTVFGKLLNKLL